MIALQGSDPVTASIETRAIKTVCGKQDVTTMQRDEADRGHLQQSPSSSTTFDGMRQRERCLLMGIHFAH